MKTLALLLILSLGANLASAQSLEAGRLLVARESLGTSSFAETVILILHHGQDGALGVAINRPTWVDAGEVFPNLEFLLDYADRIYFGGPLAPASLVTLIRIADIGDLDFEPLIDDVYVSADPDFLNQFVSESETEQVFRVYAGHAGWEGGQLEREIAAGAWRVVPATPEHIFSTEPLELWAELQIPESELMVEAERGGSIDTAELFSLLREVVPRVR